MSSHFLGPHFHFITDTDFYGLYSHTFPITRGTIFHSLASVKVCGTKWIEVQMKEQTQGPKHIFSRYGYCFVVYQEKFYYIFVYSSTFLYICTMYPQHI